MAGIMISTNFPKGRCLKIGCVKLVFEISPILTNEFLGCMVVFYFI